MDMVKDFVNEYSVRYNYYRKLAELCNTKCREQLRKSGIRSIVSYRAKSPESLEKKIIYRMKNAHYKSKEDIKADMKDLAGVRVALYFPRDIEEVEKIILSEFDLAEEPSKYDGSYLEYDKRFAGYRARHYKVRLKEHVLINNIPYNSEIIEIQVASVLMHAWAEVEHDLAYKMPEGGISDMEYALLAQLNGLVHSGEVTLEQLQTAINSRLESEERPFLDHYELASYILKNIPENLKYRTAAPTLGRADLLFEILKKLDKNKPSEIKKYLNSLVSGEEDKPLTLQLLEAMLNENNGKTVKDLYDFYQDISKEISKEAYMVFNTQFENNYKKNKLLIDEFLLKCVEFESTIRKVMANKKYELDDLQKIIQLYQKNGKEASAKVEDLYEMRNCIIRGIRVPSQNELTDAIIFMGKMLEKLNKLDNNGQEPEET